MLEEINGLNEELLCLLKEANGFLRNYGEAEKAKKAINVSVITTIGNIMDQQDVD